MKLLLLVILSLTIILSFNIDYSNAVLIVRDGNRFKQNPDITKQFNEFTDTIKKVNYDNLFNMVKEPTLVFKNKNYEFWNVMNFKFGDYGHIYHMFEIRETGVANSILCRVNVDDNLKTNIQNNRNKLMTNVHDNLRNSFNRNIAIFINDEIPY